MRFQRYAWILSYYPLSVSTGVSLSFFATPDMAFQFRNRPYVTEGGVDPQSVVNFLKDAKGYPTNLDVGFLPL